MPNSESDFAKHHFDWYLTGGQWTAPKKLDLSCVMRSSVECVVWIVLHLFTNKLWYLIHDKEWVIKQAGSVAVMNFHFDETEVYFSETPQSGIFQYREVEWNNNDNKYTQRQASSPHLITIKGDFFFHFLVFYLN